jgi:hypothetical protein
MAKLARRRRKGGRLNFRRDRQMLKNLYNFAVLEWGSIALVFVSGATVGEQARYGLNQIQIMGAAAAVLGSIAVAVMVRVKPKKVPAKR